MPQTHKQLHITETRHVSVALASVWMIAVSVALFVVPAINGFVGGVVGGYKAGSVGRGLVAAVIAAPVLAIGSWLGFVGLHLQFVQFVGELALSAWALASSAGMILGALVGGALAPMRLDY